MTIATDRVKMKLEPPTVLMLARFVDRRPFDRYETHPIGAIEEPGVTRRSESKANSQPVNRGAGDPLMAAAVEESAMAEGSLKELGVADEAASQALSQETAAQKTAAQRTAVRKTAAPNAAARKDEANVAEKAAQASRAETAELEDTAEQVDTPSDALRRRAARKLSAPRTKSPRPQSGQASPDEPDSAVSSVKPATARKGEQSRPSNGAQRNGAQRNGAQRNGAQRNGAQRNGAQRVVRKRRVAPAKFAPIDIAGQPQRKTRGVFRLSMGFCCSTLIHAGLILVLALLTMTIPALDIWSLTSSPRELEPATPVVELEMESLLSAGSAAPLLDERRDDPRVKHQMVLSDNGRPLSSARLSDVDGKGLEGPVNDVRNLRGDLANEREIRERGEGNDGGTASFFGIEATGQSFVYVVDCSNSMEGRRWRRALYELQRSIENLATDQHFYVVFFSGQAHPMFGERLPDLNMLEATEENRTRFRRWMGSVKVGDFTRPMESMQYALHLEPDAIFLLSDGEFQDDTLGFLRLRNPDADAREQGAEPIPIHTVCFESPIGQHVLGVVASENAGTFRFVP